MPPKNDENVINQPIVKVVDVKDKRKSASREELPAATAEEHPPRREPPGRSLRLPNGFSDSKPSEAPTPRLTVTPVPYSDTHKSEHVHKRDISLTAPVINSSETPVPERPQRPFVYEPGLIEPIQNPIAPSIFSKKLTTVPEVPKEEKRERVPVIYRKMPVRQEPTRRSTTSQEAYAFERFENDDKLFCFPN